MLFCSGLKLVCWYLQQQKMSILYSILVFVVFIFVQLRHIQEREDLYLCLEMNFKFLHALPCMAFASTVQYAGNRL